MLERDAPEDMDTAKAVLETLNLLCEVEESEGKVGTDTTEELADAQES